MMTHNLVAVDNYCMSVHGNLTVTVIRHAASMSLTLIFKTIVANVRMSNHCDNQSVKPRILVDT